jgi:CBS domain containing-hemolysin-like protein
MPLSVLLMVLALPILLLASGFFSGSETALFSLSKQQRTSLARSTTVAAGTITRLLHETRALLITLLLGNMIINVLYINTASLLTLHLSRMPAVGGTLAAASNIVPLIALIMFGEVLPKQLAARLPLTWARLIALPMRAVHRVIGPLRVFFLFAVITPLARLIAPRTRAPALSPDELESLLTLSQHRGVIDTDEEELLQQVLQLSRMKVCDLMRPRIKVVGFELHRSPDELMQLIREKRLRHIPVYDGDIDHITGLLHTRQVLARQPGQSQEVRALIRQVRFVPEQQRADRLLLELRNSGTTVAIAVDEYGGTAGLVTIEDVVEHVVGDIPGEFEKSGEPELEQLGPGRWRAGTTLSVQEWIQMLAGPEAAPQEAVRTLGGLIMARLGRLPEPGDTVTVGNVFITLERTAGPRLISAIIELKQPQKDQAADERG